MPGHSDMGMAAPPVAPALAVLTPVRCRGRRALRYLAVARDGALCLLGPHPSSPMLAGPLRPKSEARPLMAALLGVDGRILRERELPAPGCSGLMNGSAVTEME